MSTTSPKSPRLIRAPSGKFIRLGSSNVTTAATNTARHRKLKQFFKFASLPPELRRMIWTWALPVGERVLFGPEFTSPVNYFVEDLANYPSYPDTLFASSESRSVTLEHYILPCHHSPFGAYLPRKGNKSVTDGRSMGASTTCFDPAVDTLVLGANAALRPGTTQTWIQHFHAIFPRRMAKITRIEIPYILNAHPVATFAGIRGNSPGCSFVQTKDQEYKAVGPLRDFAKLEKLIIRPARLNFDVDYETRVYLQQVLRPALVRTAVEEAQNRLEYAEYFRLVNEDLKTEGKEKRKIPAVEYKWYSAL